jgi:hypothetical protein
VFAVSEPAFAVCLWHTANGQSPVVNTHFLGLYNLTKSLCFGMTAEARAFCTQNTHRIFAEKEKIVAYIIVI